MQKVIKYAKKILIWLGFISTAILLYSIWARLNAAKRTDEHFKQLHKSDKRIKDYLGTAETNARDIKTRIKDAADDNSTALSIVSRLEQTNERFRQLLREIQEDSGD